MKKVFLIIGSLILLAAIPVVVFFIGQQQEVRSKAAPATSLSIQPANPTVAVGDTVAWKIIMNTGTNNVVSAKISLIFDQTKLEALSFTNSTLAPRILNPGTVGAGTATITIAASSTTTPIHGSGEVAILRTKAIGGSTTPVAIQFGPDTFVAGIGDTNVSVLSSTQAGSITITGGSPETTLTLTPTPTITGTQTPSPTGPTGTPTTTPTETISVTPTITGTPTATSSALSYTVTEESTSPGKPLIKGTSPSGATITIVIHSNPAQTQVVTAETNGQWQARPQVTLQNGTYTIVVTSLNVSTGGTETISSTFTVTNSSGTGGTTTTGDEMPQSGSMETTIMLLILSISLISIGGISFATKRL